MRCVGRRGIREANEIYGGRTKVKEAISRKKDAHKAMCRNSTEENKNMYEKYNKEISFKSIDRKG